VAAEVTDSGISGATLDRPGLNRVRELARAGEIEAVVVYDLDRLSRKAVYQMLIEEELAKSHVSVHYVLGDYRDDDEGRLQKQVRAAVAEYERAKFRERIVRGRKGKARAGYVVLGGSEIYGYTVKREPHKAWLVVNEDEAQIVRLIFRLYAYGDANNGPMTLTAIARFLTKMGVPTKADRLGYKSKTKGKGQWGRSTIAGMLHNTAYIGSWYYNRTKWENRRAVPRPREEWIQVEVPAIIDMDLWEVAQKRRMTNAHRAKRNRRRNYLLVSHLTCARCGSSVQGKTIDHKKRGGRVYQYYRCGGLNDEGAGAKCDLPYFSVEQLDAVVWNWVENILLHPDQLAAGLRQRQAQITRAGQALRERLNLLDSQIKEQNQQLQRLLDLYLSSADFPKEMLTERKTMLEKTKSELERERAGLVAHLEETTVTDAQIEELETFADLVRNGLEHVQTEDKRRILDLLELKGVLAVENGQKVVYLRCEVDSATLSIASSAD
jgi:site-specific DNA recombinase